MTFLVCLLEEPSAREMLEAILPKVLPQNVSVRYRVFEGKQDLEKQLARRIREWNKFPDTYFLVMRDQDSGNCLSIKERLRQKIETSGKPDRTLIRIACRELESFYLGDLQAVEQGLKIKHVADRQEQKKYRTPDYLGNPCAELEKLTRQNYQKIQGSRDIAPHLQLNGSNRSHSFNVLISGLRDLFSG